MKAVKNASAKRQQGYSLVELSVALAIVAVIVVGGLMGTRQILLTNNVNNQLKDSAQVVAKVIRQYQKQNSTAGVSTATLAPLGVWPAERTTNAAGVWDVRGIIGGSTEHVFPNDVGIGSLAANSGFVYTIRNVPSAACADMVSGLDSMSFAIYAGPSPAVAPLNGATPATAIVKVADTAQVNPVTLAAGCSSANAMVDITAVIRI